MLAGARASCNPAVRDPTNGRPQDMAHGHASTRFRSREFGFIVVRDTIDGYVHDMIIMLPGASALSPRPTRPTGPILPDGAGKPRQTGRQASGRTEGKTAIRMPRRRIACGSRWFPNMPPDRSTACWPPLPTGSSNKDP